MKTPLGRLPQLAMTGNMHCNRLLVIAGLAVLISLVAISGRTFWIDEALTGVKAQTPTLAAWWAEIVQERASDLQMPFYMLYVWGWEKLAGSSEWALRLANLPWFVIGVCVFAWGQRRADTRCWLTVGLVLLSPFAWYYLDEARPYAMQLGASLMVAGALCRLALDPRQDNTPSAPGAPNREDCSSRPAVCWFLAGVVVMSGSSMLGMVWAGAAVAGLVLVAPGNCRRLLLRCWLVSAAAGLILLALAGYFLWTLTIGARASAGATTTLQSVLFIGYELAGFMGLGPGRLNLREGGASALGPYLPWLGLYGVAVAILLLVGVRETVRTANKGEAPSADRIHRKWLLAGAVAFPAIFLIVVGLTMNFRVLGRHFTPLFPVIALLLGSGAAQIWARRPFLGGAVVVLFLGMSMASAGAIRFSAAHARDDYRGATAIAKGALRSGNSVWWNAAGQGARFYGLPVAENPSAPGVARLCLNPHPEDLVRETRPNLIITSKPDVYDNTGTLGRYLGENGYVKVRRLPAFVVWAEPETDKADN
jgi:hypothetical protein